MAINPIGERVLLKPLEQKEKTAGGIYIPDSAKDDKKEAEVVAVSSAIKDAPIKPGDRVLYGGYSSDEFEREGQKYLVIEMKDILAILE